MRGRLGLGMVTNVCLPAAVYWLTDRLTDRRHRMIGTTTAKTTMRSSSTKPAQAIATSTPAYTHTGVVVSGVRRMNEVNARRARLVLGWVTVFGRVYHLGM